MESGKKGNVINNADTKDLAKKRDVKNLYNREDSTMALLPESLQHQQGTEQPQFTNPFDGYIIVSESSRIRQNELHSNQATAQPPSKNPVNVTTDNNGIIVIASASILNEESIVAQATTQPRNTTPINMTKTTMHPAEFCMMNCF
jgi:hypothetical protein